MDVHECHGGLDQCSAAGRGRPCAPQLEQRFYSPRNRGACLCGAAVVQDGAASFATAHPFFLPMRFFSRHVPSQAYTDAHAQTLNKVRVLALIMMLISIGMALFAAYNFKRRGDMLA